jgi:hypothetical protein
MPGRNSRNRQDSMRTRRTLPNGIAIEQIATALEAITTARASYRLTVRLKGRDIPAVGEGLIDFGRNIESYRLSVNGKQLEHIDAGADRFHLLPPNRQQDTGKRWAWEKGCPYGSYWAQVFAAVRDIARCTGSGAEVMAAGETVHRYSFLIKPRRKTILHTHLQGHGLDRVNLDIWLAADQTIRKIRDQKTALEIALFDGRTNTVSSTAEYSDFGAAVDLAAPPADEVLGSPAE